MKYRHFRNVGLITPVLLLPENPTREWFMVQSLSSVNEILIYLSDEGVDYCAILLNRGDSLTLGKDTPYTGKVLVGATVDSSTNIVIGLEASR